jgi:hypothetical protein
MKGPGHSRQACLDSGRVLMDEPPRAPDLAPQRKRGLEFAPHLRPRLCAQASGTESRPCKFFTAKTFSRIDCLSRRGKQKMTLRFGGLVCMRAVVSGTVLLMLLVVLVTTSPAGAATIVFFVLLGVALDAAEEEVMTEGHPAECSGRDALGGRHNR